MSDCMRPPPRTGTDTHDRARSYAPYCSVGAAAGQAASALLGAGGVSEGSFVVLCGATSPALVVATLGVLLAGCVLVPLPPTLPAEAMAAVLRATAPAAVFADAGAPAAGVAAALRAADGRPPAVRCVLPTGVVPAADAPPAAGAYAASCAAVAAAGAAAAAAAAGEWTPLAALLSWGAATGPLVGVRPRGPDSPVAVLCVTRACTAYVNMHMPGGPTAAACGRVLVSRVCAAAPH